MTTQTATVAHPERTPAFEPSPAPQAAPTATVWLAPLASAVLLYLSFFPVACGWLAWFALVPWLCLVRLPGRPRRLYLAAYLGAVVFFGSALQWMRVADARMYVTWISLALYCSAYVPLLLWALRRLERRTPLPLVVTFPLAWVALEFWRWGFIGSFASVLLGSHEHDLPGGFGWYFLGHSQHDFLEVIQVADLGGAYAVSLVVAAVNAVLFEALYRRGWFRRTFLGDAAPAPYGTKAILIQGIAVAALLLGVLAYGVWRLGEDTTTPGPRLALLQGNVDQRLRNISSGPDGEGREKARELMVAHFSDLAGVAARQHPDLIVWPETSYPGLWEEVAPGRPSRYSRELADEVSKSLRTPVLLGMNAAVAGADHKIHSYNSAILLDRDGAWQGRYDKTHLVPFGEYIPVRSWLPFLNRLAPYDFDYAVEPGGRFTRFPLAAGGRRYRFGVMICYEDTNPDMARPYAEGEPVDFILNISNDGWFDGSSEHDQHLALCRFRAVETRRAVARAVNMGISAVIDSDGRVLAPRLAREEELVVEGRRVTVPVWEVPQTAESLPVSAWGEYKKVAGVLVAGVPIDSRRTVYAGRGDCLAAGCGALVLAALAGTIRRRRTEAAR
jgi:apolipoprotein N-acyltransferase